MVYSEPPASPPQGCPEAQPGLQAQEAPPTTCTHHPGHVHLPHGLQWHSAAVASSSAPLPAQGGLQGQGKPQQLRKGSAPCQASWVLWNWTFSLMPSAAVPGLALVLHARVLPTWSALASGSGLRNRDQRGSCVFADLPSRREASFCGRAPEEGRAF